LVHNRVPRDTTPASAQASLFYLPEALQAFSSPLDRVRPRWTSIPDRFHCSLSFQVYDCCSNSCVCFTGEFESLTACPLCSEQRYNGWQKARNQFCYIPIIPHLQVMFQDQDVIELLRYRLQHEADPNRFDDVWDGANLWELLNKKIEFNGQVQWNWSGMEVRRGLTWSDAIRG
jgi:hypothetical protein